MTTRHLLPLACCIFLAGSSLSVAADIVQLDGKTVQGTVVGVEGDSLLLKGGDGTPVKVSVKTLAEVNLGNKVVVPLPGEVFDEIELTDGSLLRVANAGTLIKKLAFTVTPAVSVKDVPPPTVALGYKHVFYWLRKANTGAVRADWKLKVVEKRGKQDLLVLYSEATGFEPLEGAFGAGTEDGTTIEFEDGGGKKPGGYPLTKITGGLLFAHPPEAVLPPTAGRVFDVFGNNLLATSVAIDEKTGKVTVKTVSGAVVEYASIAAISRMDFAQGNVKYLAELDPTVDAPPPVPNEPHQPFLVGKSRAGDGLRVGGKAYAKGVWVAPDSTLKYNLNGNYREFKAIVGIDDAVPVATSKVTLVVEVDGQKLVSQTFEKTLKENKPLELNLNVKDAKELKITVEREALFSGEGLNFADARLQK